MPLCCNTSIIFLSEFFWIALGIITFLEFRPLVFLHFLFIFAFHWVVLDIALVSAIVLLEVVDLAHIHLEHALGTLDSIRWRSSLSWRQLGYLRLLWFLLLLSLHENFVHAFGQVVDFLFVQEKLEVGGVPVAGGQCHDRQNASLYHLMFIF